MKQDTNTYNNKPKYTNMLTEMPDQERLVELAWLTNRHERQLTEHWNLVGKNWKKLFELENKMHNNHLSYGCGDKEDVQEVLYKGYGKVPRWNYNHYYLDECTKSMVYLCYYVDKRMPQLTEGKYQGPKDKEYFYKYLWNEYATENFEMLRKLKMVDANLLRSVLV